MRSCLICLLLTAASGNAIEPAPVETRTIDRNLYTTLRDVHNVGADLYNRGDAAGCCRVFEGALPVAAAMLSHRLNEQKLIADTLAAARRENDVSRRAFILHATIEKLRDRLKPPARIVEESVPPPLVEKKKDEPKATPKPPIVTSDPLPKVPPRDPRMPDPVVVPEKKEAARKEEPVPKPPLILIDEDPTPTPPKTRPPSPKDPRPETISVAPRVVRKEPPTRQEGVYGRASFDGAPLKGYEISFHSVANPLKKYRETVDADGFYAFDSLAKGKYAVVLIPGPASAVVGFPQRYRSLDTTPLAIEVVKSGERVNFILGKMDP